MELETLTELVTFSLHIFLKQVLNGKEYHLRLMYFNYI